MAPEQFAAEHEGADRDRYMTRAERAAYWGPRKRWGFMRKIEERAITHGHVRLSGGYPGLLSYGGEATLDRFMVMTQMQGAA